MPDTVSKKVVNRRTIVGSIAVFVVILTILLIGTMRSRGAQGPVPQTDRQTGRQAPVRGGSFGSRGVTNLQPTEVVLPDGRTVACVTSTSHRGSSSPYADGVTCDWDHAH